MKSLAAAVLIVIAAPASGEQASVDFGSLIRPLTHTGTGALHSISPTAPNDSLFEPLKIGNYRQSPNSPVYDRAAEFGIGNYQVVVSDKYHEEGVTARPGDNGDWSEWEEYCRTVATQALNQNLNVQFDIWNEPDQPIFWGRSHAQFLETWKRGVRAVREVNPNATIVGPSASQYWWHTNISVEEVLTYAKANDVLPDVVSWHTWGRELPVEVERFKQFAAANDIDGSRISLNETLWWFDQYRPGPVVYFLDQVEKNHIESAMKSCWQTCGNNSLNGIITGNGEPRSIWWLYERYGRMTGSSVMTVSGGETLDIMASQDEGLAYALVGRYKDSFTTYRDTYVTVNHPDVILPAEVVLQNLDDVPALVFGNKVHVLAELIKNSEAEASSGPVVKINVDFAVVNGQLKLSLADFGTFDAYALTLTPAWSSVPGDFNGDGVVDGADYVVLRKVGGSGFDANYDVWRRNIGSTTPLGAPGSGLSAVPEPGTVSLLAIALAIGASSRRRLRIV